jgi:phage gpG-like protein
MRQLAKVPSRASRAIADDIAEEIQRTMDDSTDPYGRPWRRKRNGKRSILKRSGRGRRGIIVSPTSGAGFRIVVTVLYMIYHQFGGKSHLRGHKKHPHFGRDQDRSAGRNRPPKRSFLPFDRIPKRWEEIVQKRIDEMARRVLRG